ncbi:hypothetical protein BDU57DRAFT_574831 [Ampelomyces quisqualis]|uniref:Uncharacterized protein n=1 Tax=Ampelomyces quisqualis TaxID=50730 RepID=A0A6A5QQ48_AMPQU|nr:hypothetical protein BDU57DRAFT_574831 [Ampelomyces quisqualis]
MSRNTIRYDSEFPQELECDWLYKELIPMLMVAYGRSKAYWKEGVRQAYGRINDLAIYEDFETTVERFRLLLVNPDILSRAEIADFGFLRDSHAICIQVFVRHFIRHGEYKLHSFGKDPDPLYPRRILTEEYQDSYIFAGKLAMKRTVFKNKHDAPWTRRRAPQNFPVITDVEDEPLELKDTKTSGEQKTSAVSRTLKPHSTTQQLVSKVDHPLPQRPEYTFEALRKTSRRSQTKSHGIAPRGQSSKGPCGDYPPRRDHGTLPTYTQGYPPREIIGPSMPPANMHQQNHPPVIAQAYYQNGPAYGYPTMPSHGYAANDRPALTPAPQLPYVGQGSGQPYQYTASTGPGYYRTSPGYAAQYGYRGERGYPGRNIPQIDDGSDSIEYQQSHNIPSTPQSVDDGSCAGFQGTASEFQPGTGAPYLHLGASAFVPGAYNRGF